MYQTQNDAQTDSDAAPRLDYTVKSSAYFAGVRRDFLDLLQRRPPGAVLELGCGFGETGAAALAEGLCRTYSGIEIATKAASVARENLTEVLEGDVERMALPWPESHFDAVLMSEVLEHLVNPWDVVDRIARHLKPGALVVASSPNVAQIRVIRGLLNDRWELTDSGLMDRTHLRWFTQRTYRRMFEDAGIRVDRVRPMAPPGRWGTLFNTVTFGKYRHLTMRQICIEGHRV